MARPGFLRRIYPSFATLYMRPRTAADLRAREASVATTRRDPGLRAVSELWGSFTAPEHDLRGQAASITAPTLLIWGRRDPVIPLRVGKRLANAIPGAKLVVLQAGHVPYTSRPEEFAAHLVPFADAALDRASSPRVPV